MSATTVSQFAIELKMPVSALLEQLSKAGVSKGGASDTLTDQDKTKLLDYLRRSHGEAQTKTKITLTRKQTSEIKATDAQGRARTVQVEVRKKRVLVKRDDASEQAAEVASEIELSSAVEPVVEPVVEIVPEPVVEVIPEPVVEVAPEPIVEEIPEPEPEPVVEAVAPEAPAEPVAEVQPVKPAPVLDRAAIIGEKELKAREEEARRRNRLREIQERELKEKQAREAQLVIMRQQAEAAAAAAKAAEQAKQQAAAQAKAGEGEKGTLHKRPDAPGTKKADKNDKGGRAADEGKKNDGLKTHGV